MMLGNGQCPQRPIKNMTRSGQTTLIGHEDPIVHPNARHFVHKYQSPLKGVIHLLIHAVIDGTSAHLLATGAQIVVPDFVATRQLLQGTFVDNIHSIVGRLGLMINVAQPVLDRVGIPKNFLLIGYILLGLRKKHFI